MPASEEPGSGPVIHDHRRIDPVTGQVRGRHAASKPAGTTGAGRPAGPGSPGTGAGSGSAGSGSGSPGSGSAGGASGSGSAGGASGSGSAGGASGTASGAADAASGPDEAGTADATEEVLEGIVEDAPVSDQNVSGQNVIGQKQSDAEARLAERTADLQRLQAEYANYRKRVDRDRAAVREQAIATVLTGLLPVLDAIDQAREHGELSGGFKSVADSLQSAVGKLGLVAYGDKGDVFDPKIHEALTSTYSPDVTEDTCVEIFQPGYKVGEKILRPARVAVAAPATGPDGSSNEATWSDGEEGN
ncbi:MAG TPA: nucleotide exchange factor GrpE [Streptosporangiaceae bacterium]|nr:nucleotide exchange factor GrpE [Streptosporangiaceae bacterium]